jgi:DHA1 family bicyclomycin/chloramphenicol resistance-like MFS transporter
MKNSACEPVQRNPVRLPPIALLMAVSAIGPFVLNGVLPANSAVMRDLQTHYSLVQLVLTVFLLANLLGQLVFGYAADRWGRRPILIFSLLVFSFGGAICALSVSIEWLLCGRFVQGFGAATCMVIPRTIVRDVYPRDRAASIIGYMTTAMMIAPMFGPMIGGWVTDNFNWRYLYVGLSLVGALLSILAWRFQHETLAQSEASRRRLSWLGATKILFTKREYVAFVLMMTGSVGVYYCFLAAAPYVVMESRELSATLYGQWFSVIAVGYMSGNLVAGRFSVALGAVRMARLGLIPFFVAVLLFWLFSMSNHPAALFLPMCLVAFSNGATLPNLLSAAMSVVPELSATASGVAGSIQTAFGVIASLVLGIVLLHSDNWMFVAISLASAICLLGCWLSRAST